jgi:hypothetical protein
MQTYRLKCIECGVSETFTVTPAELESHKYGSDMPHEFSFTHFSAQELVEHEIKSAYRTPGEPYGSCTECVDGGDIYIGALQ